MTPDPAESRPEPRWELGQYYRIAVLSLATLAPMTALLAWAAWASDSLTLALQAVWFAVGSVVAAFEVAGLRRAVIANAFTVPYGGGKFESLGGLVRGVFFVPLGLFALVAVAARLVAPVEVGYELALVMLLLELGSSVVFLWLKERLIRRVGAPSQRLREAYSLRRSMAFHSAVVMLALAVGLALEDAGVLAWGERIDPVMALFVAVYMAQLGVVSCWRNFNQLIDRPLKGEERAVVEGIAAEVLGDWRGGWDLTCRASGLERWVELELDPVGDVTLAEAARRAGDIEARLLTSLEDVRFRFFVVTGEPPA